MNRKTVISLSVIALLALVLAVQKMRGGKDVPSLDDISGLADELLVKSADYSIDLKKDKDGWKIAGKGYPADSNIVEGLEKKISTINIVDLISGKGYYDKYELGESRALSVVLKQEGRVLRKVLIGKAGTTNNHVYVRVDDRPEVFLATGLFREDFKSEADSLRDKKIFSVKKEALERFSISYGGRTYTFLPSVENKKEGEGKEEGKQPDPAGVRKWYCREFRDAELKEAKINSIASSFESFRADTFPEGMDRKKLGRPEAVVTLRAYDRDISFAIYGMAGKGKRYASSSESGYVFTVGSWMADRFFIKSIKDIVK